MKLLITTGSKTPKIIKKIFNNNKFTNISLITNQNFNELENTLSSSNLLISCHGSISHLCAALNIKQVDIINENTKNPYKNWTKHFRNYNFVYRNKFEIMSKEIIKIL